MNLLILTYSWPEKLLLSGIALTSGLSLNSYCLKSRMDKTTANMINRMKKKNMNTFRSMNTYLIMVTKNESSSKILRKKNVLISKSIVTTSIRIMFMVP